MNDTYSRHIQNRGWMSLDNAAKIYPPVISKSLSSVFRIGCILNEPVRIDALRKSLEQTSVRFPYFLTSLRRGFFWYFLEYDDSIRPSLVREDKKPCVAFPVKKGHFALFRIVVKDRMLSVEFLHVLTDGGGALEFFRMLLVSYLRNCGYNVPYSEGIIDPSSRIDLSETEDSYNKYFKKNVPMPPKMGNAWHLPFQQQDKSNFGIIQALIPIAELKNLVKKSNVTITEYLASVYLYCLQDIYLKSRLGKNQIIRLEIPVNMRRSYPSKTMRNFSLFVLPELDMRLGSFSFEEILRSVHNYMQSETENKKLIKVLARNVKPEKNILIRAIPVFIKDMVLAAMYKKHGASKYSGVLTNIGMVNMPEEVQQHIESMLMLPPPPVRQLKISCGIVSFRENICISFTNNTISRELEKGFFSFLVKKNIRVRIQNNIWNGRQNMS